MSPPNGVSPQVISFPSAVSTAKANPFRTLYVGEARMGSMVSAPKLGREVGHRDIEGAAVGEIVGAEVGTAVGTPEGSADGVAVGSTDGAAVGSSLGAEDGDSDGGAVGDAVGEMKYSIVAYPCVVPAGTELLVTVYWE
jgi:hypothetical protein